MIKWTDFALLDDFGAILSAESIEGLNYISQDIRRGAVSPKLQVRSIRMDAEDGMRIQETGSESKPARMVGSPETEERKDFPLGRKLDSDERACGDGTRPEGGG